ncbi:proline-rich proteoglycan 2-like [Cervus elaphus]|uniref:proline-rich proteoglycan 2-like n=1 Tax=Cervus elaphus TaxID=9860 RepID=UPI001CC31742|nr:proline-rich proteoglycan 2-like [Cervus elaphus]
MEGPQAQLRTCASFLGGKQAEPWVGGARGPFLDSGARKESHRGAAVLGVPGPPEEPDLPRHPPESRGYATPDRGAAPAPERERTVDTAHTQRRGTRAPVRAEAHWSLGRGWIQPDDPARLPGPRLGEKKGDPPPQLRAGAPPANSGPRPRPLAPGAQLGPLILSLPGGPERRDEEASRPSVVPCSERGARDVGLRPSKPPPHPGGRGPPSPALPPRTQLLTRLTPLPPPGPRQVSGGGGERRRPGPRLLSIEPRPLAGAGAGSAPHEPVGWGRSDFKIACGP